VKRAKNRKTYNEAFYGDAASYGDGLVGFYLAKRQFLELKRFMLEALEKLPAPSDVQKKYLVQLRVDVDVLKEEFASLTLDAPKEYAGFLENVAKAQNVKSPAYPTEVKMLEIFAQRCLVEKRPMTQDELWKELIDAKHPCERSKFDAMLKRYGLKSQLGKGKPGRQR
jgi:hypothetical protein